MNDLQKRTAQAIVNIFETGTALGDYGRVTYVADDPGQLTYGRSQVTLASGTLHLLIEDYCGRAEARQGAALAPFLPALEAKAPSCNTDMTLRGLLHAAGADPAMRACQDEFFDRAYWNPAVKAANALGLASALSVAVVYDSFVHGSWKAMRDATTAKVGKPDASNPDGWTGTYVATRRDWLAGSANPLLRKCVYRMDSFRQLIDQDAWPLPLPLTVRGIVLTPALLAGGADASASAAGPAERVLRLARPPMTGDDVREAQAALGIAADGVFDDNTREAVIAFQAARGLSADGIIGPVTRSALGL